MERGSGKETELGSLSTRSSLEGKNWVWFYTQQLWYCSNSYSSSLLNSHSISREECEHIRSGITEEARARNSGQVGGSLVR